MYILRKKAVQLLLSSNEDTLTVMLVKIQVSVYNIKVKYTYPKAAMSTFISSKEVKNK